MKPDLLNPIVKVLAGMLQDESWPKEKNGPLNLLVPLAYASDNSLEDQPPFLSIQLNKEQFDYIKGQTQ